MFFHKQKDNTAKKAVFATGLILITASLLLLLAQGEIGDYQASIIRASTTTEMKNCTIPFPDIACDSPYIPAVTWAKTKGIISGYPDGNFFGNKTLNRAESLKMVIQAMYPDESLSSNKETTIFRDVAEDSWFFSYLILGIRNGIINVETKTVLFRGENLVLQSEFMKMSLRAAKFITSTSPSTPWYKEYMDYATVNKLFPFEWSKNDPEQNVTRFEAVETLYRMAKHTPQVPVRSTTSAPKAS